jgi:23S rRNA pseudouridine1911/1915/1917 synthase
LARVFERGEVEKGYLALVHGHVARASLTNDAPIGKIDARYQYPVEYEHGKANDLATYLPKRRVDPSGKPARTRVEVLQHAGAFTSLRVIPEQGRTNQIRVHLAHAGHPIVGDKIYSLSGEFRDEQLRGGLTPRVCAALVLPRHALHCETLAFDHPLEGTRIELRAPVPADLAGWLGSGVAAT